MAVPPLEIAQEGVHRHNALAGRQAQTMSTGETPQPAVAIAPPGKQSIQPSVAEVGSVGPLPQLVSSRKTPVPLPWQLPGLADGEQWVPSSPAMLRVERSFCLLALGERGKEDVGVSGRHARRFRPT